MPVTHLQEKAMDEEVKTFTDFSSVAKAGLEELKAGRNEMNAVMKAVGKIGANIKDGEVTVVASEESKDEEMKEIADEVSKKDQEMKDETSSEIKEKDEEMKDRKEAFDS
ncbi:uncharacterized protein LOC118185685 [Stegodyphus dumicola]|uniref:uncharacterized protein LOC118185685 n=1 Tax=Stegodyphus dumicola TaxID=202533 RepID=UPI0015ACD911|nr:uncharacterized protein LOC118185685 [Stegodyphus dumicola]